MLTLNLIIAKLYRRNVIRRKNANIKQIQQQQQLEMNNKPILNNIIGNNLIERNQLQLQQLDTFTNNSTIVDNNGQEKSFLQISLFTNASCNRVYSTIRQALLNRDFLAQYSNTINANCLTMCNINAFTGSAQQDHILEEEIRFGLKNVSSFF